MGQALDYQTRPEPLDPPDPRWLNPFVAWVPLLCSAIQLPWTAFAVVVAWYGYGDHEPIASQSMFIFAWMTLPAGIGIVLGTPILIWLMTRRLTGSPLSLTVMILGTLFVMAEMGYIGVQFFR
jgi:hypothetical protein